MPRYRRRRPVSQWLSHVGSDIVTGTQLNEAIYSPALVTPTAPETTLLRLRGCVSAHPVPASDHDAGSNNFYELWLGAWCGFDTPPDVSDEAFHSSEGVLWSCVLTYAFTNHSPAGTLMRDIEYFPGLSVDVDSRAKRRFGKSHEGMICYFCAKAGGIAASRGWQVARAIRALVQDASFT